MAMSFVKIGLRATALNLEKATCVLVVHNIYNTQAKKIVHTKQVCNGPYCSLTLPTFEGAPTQVSSRGPHALTSRAHSRHHGQPEKNRRKDDSDSDSDSDSDTECKGKERSDFWRRKMRTVHNIMDVDKDGLISYGDYQLFAKRFVSLGHLDEKHAKEFAEIMKKTWTEQWGEIDSFNLITVEKYLEEMNHVLNDKSLKKKATRWLPYLFKAVDKDNSGFISVKEFKLYFQCLGLSDEQAAVAFAVIDQNGDGKLSLKEFLKLGRDFFISNDEKRVSKMFWGPLVNH